jgi:hypothetical protein
MKAIRVATICHNEDDYQQKYRRVRLELTKAEGGYVWHTGTGEDCCLGEFASVYDAEIAALRAWGAAV